MLLILGGLIALLGLLLLLAGRVPYPSTRSFDKLRTASGHRLGRLPGDLTLRRDGLTIYFPVVTWLALSLALTIILNLAFWMLRR